VNFLCPPPFDKLHDMLLKQFLSIDVDFETKTRRIFGLHADGYIFPVDFVITPSTNANSDLVLIGKFSNKTDPTKHLVMVDAYTNVITACSRSACEILGFEQTEVFTMNVQIEDVFPDFFDEDKSAKLQSKYLKGRRDDTVVNNYRLCVEAKKSNFDSKPESAVFFKLATILVTFQVLEHYSDDEDDSLEGDCDNSDIDEDYAPIPQDDQAHGKSSAIRLGSFSTEEVPPAAAMTDSLIPKNLGIAKPVSNRVSINKGKVVKGPASIKSGGSRHSRGKQSKGGTSGNGSILRGAGGASSTYSSSSADLSIRRIHRVIGQKLSGKDPRLAMFAVFAKYFTLFFITMAIIESILIISLYNTFLERTSLVEKSHLRLHHMLEIATMVEFLRNPSFVVNGTEQFRQVLHPKETLISLASSMKEEHLSLIEFSDKSSQPIVWNLLHLPDMQVTYDGDLFSNISFHLAVLDFLVHVENYIHTDNMKCKASCRFILNNAPMEILKKSMLSGPTYEQDAEVINELVQDIASYSIFVVAGLLIFAFYKGFFPMFITTSQRKSEIGNAFVAVDRQKIQDLYKRTEKRIRSIQSNRPGGLFDDEDDDEAMIESSGEMDLKTSCIENKIQPVNVSRSCWTRLKMMMRRKTNVLDAKIAPGTNTLKTPNLKSEPAVRFVSRIVSTIAKVGISFWIVLVFFVSMALLDHSSGGELVAFAARKRMAGLKTMYLDCIHFWVIQLPLGTEIGFRDNFNNRTDLLDEYRSKVVTYDRYLKYGNESLHVEPFEGTSGDLFDLYFSETACSDECQSIIIANGTGYTSEIATALSHGLNLGIERYMTMVAGLMEVMNDYTSDLISVESTYEVKSLFNNFALKTIIAETMERVTVIYSDMLLNAVLEIRQAKIMGIVLFTVFMMLAFLITLKLFRKMDKELKDSQSLLFMLPLEVFLQVPEMHALVFDDKSNN